MRKKRIYLDHTTTTPLDSRVKKEMARFWSEDFGNPSSLHLEGVKAKAALDSSRKKVAKVMNCRPEELFFTSGGTESNNLAIFGYVKSLLNSDMKYPDMHFITSVIEHSSVLECFKELEHKGARVDYITVDAEGFVVTEDLKNKIAGNTVLISVMYANNEIGTIQPLHKIAGLVRGFNSARTASGVPKIVFHTDASQAPVYLDVNKDKLSADMISLDGQKIYGPKGVGALYVRRSLKISPIMFGGGQEKGIRPGTENIPLIVGFALALELASASRKKEFIRAQKLQRYFFDGLKRIFPEIIVNGGVENRLPNNVNFSLPGLDAEFSVIKLDAFGISCSTKSTCLAGEEESYVVSALGGRANRSKEALRFSFGRATSKKDIDSVLECLERLLPPRSS